jgi:hypothetical protein
MQLPYRNVRTPHLHPLPFRKGRGEKCGRRGTQRSSVIVPRFRMWFSLRVAILEARPEMARHVTIKDDRNRKKDSGVAVSTHRVFSSDAPRKNHTWETRHLAGSIRDVGSAGRYESASADLRTSGVGET